MKIGNKEVGRVFLAPVAGVSDLPFRMIAREMGADLCYTEMVSAKALCFGDKKTKKLLFFEGEPQPKAVQLFGSEPEILGKAAKMVEKDFDIIDINMGCPAPKIVKNGEGSALMKNPALAGRIIESVKKSVSIPVTVKIRRGFESDNCVEMAHVAENSGASAVCVHGRFTVQMYSGESSKDAIRRVKDAVSIPVIGNGDIFEAEDAEKMIKETGCDAVMIARGAFGNPFIFREIKALLERGERISPPTEREKIDMAIRHIEALVDFYGEKIGILNARKHGAWHTKGIRGATEAKRQIYTATSLSEMKRILQKLIG